MSAQAEDNLLAFFGTPDDWWDNAEDILVSEAENRTLGNWYISKVESAGKTRHSYRLSTPSKPANMDKLRNARGPQDRISGRVRLLIRSAAPVPAWRTSHLVMADTGVGAEVQRWPWMRTNSGRWKSLYDGRRTINDDSMAALNPAPASITEVGQ